MYSTVIFDMDGTLIDSDEVNLQSLQKAILRVESRFIPMHEVRKVSGKPGLKCIEDLGVEEKNKHKVFKQWDIEFFNLDHEYEFYAGVENLVDELVARGVNVGIVTSRTEDEYDSFFSHLDLDDKFEHIVYASDTEKHKPHPDPILKFLERAQIEKKGAIYIGDTVYDRDAANSAGIDFGLAGWNTHEVETNIILKNPSDILSMIDGQ